MFFPFCFVSFITDWQGWGGGDEGKAGVREGFLGSGGGVQRCGGLGGALRGEVLDRRAGRGE